MRKTIAILSLTMMLCLSGCAVIEKTKESTVTVNKQGVITQVLKEELPEERYSGEELSTTVTAQIEEYNYSAGGEKILLKKSEIAQGKATMILEYKTDEDYRAFNQVDFYAGNVKQAVKEKYSFAGDFVASDHKKVETGVIPDQCMEEQVMIIREPFAVKVPGEILYTSANMKILDKNHARLEENTTNPYESAGTVTKAYGYVIYRP